MGDTCIPMADSCEWPKPLQYYRVISFQLNTLKKNIAEVLLCYLKSLEFTSEPVRPPNYPRWRHFRRNFKCLPDGGN